MQGSGVILQQNREVEEFGKIEVSGSVKLNVSTGDSEQSLEVSGDDNILPFLVTETVDGTLKIYLKSGSYSMTAPIEVTATCATLQSLHCSGACRVAVERIDTEELQCHLSGASEIQLTGTCNRLSIESSGASRINSKMLVARDVRVNISGAGNAEIHASSSLSGSCSGAVKIRYAGSPASVKVSSSGASSVRELE